ncbi:hypothetical protein MMC07_007194 [Pseudocyphellaria aurata]|nr:hypothetical protein [Pseudocyphellaria aurata]
MLSLTYLVIGLGAIVSASSSPEPCAADRCFAAASFSAQQTPYVSAFCERYVHKTLGTATKTSTITVFKTFTPTAPTQSQVHVTTKTPHATTVVKTVTGHPTITSAMTCVVTSTTSLLTVVNYLTEQHTAVPSSLIARCSGSIPQQVSSACSCFLASKTTTTTITTTKTVTASTGSVSGSADTITVIATGSTVTSIKCTSTSTSYSYLGRNSCGVASPTTVNTKGVISCTSAAPPGQTNARFRIEGNDSDGTIFEDCIVSGPSDVTTPSGGTHKCDGTYDGTYEDITISRPGSTLTTFLQSAAMRDGFGFDGTYDSREKDFYITTIGRTTEVPNGGIWAALIDESIYLANCQVQLSNGHRGLWGFDARGKNVILTITPDYMVVRSGTASVQVTVQGNDGQGNVNPRKGATIKGGTISDDKGKVTIPVPQVPGCYQYKATQDDTLRSNAFYLTVLGPATYG